MADNETVGIEVVAKLEEFRKEFASLPKTTDEETKKAVALAIKNLNKMSKTAAKGAKETKESIKQAAGGFSDFGSKAGDADSTLKALAGAFGLISPGAGSALSAVGDLAGGVEGASKATALFGAAGTAALVSVAALAAGATAFAVAAVSAVSVSLDLVEGWKEIKGLGAIDSFKLDPEQIESLREGEAALDAASLAGETITVTFASMVGPTVEAVATSVTFLTLGFRQFAESMGEAEGFAASYATVLKSNLSVAFATVVLGVSAAMDAMGRLFAFAGDDIMGGTLKSGAKELKEYAQALGTEAIEKRKKAEGELVEIGMSLVNQTGKLKEATKANNQENRDAARDAKALAEREREQAKEKARTTAITKALTDAIGATKSASEALRQEEAATIAELVKNEATEEQIAEARESYAARRVALSEETSAKVQAIEKDSAASMLAAVGGYTSGRLSAEQKLEADLASVQATIIANAEKAQAELAIIAADAAAGGDTAAYEAAEAAKVKIGEETQAKLTQAAAEGQRRRGDLATSEAQATRDLMMSAVNDTIAQIGSALSAYSGLMQEKHQETQDAITAELEAQAKIQERIEDDKRGALTEGEKAASAARIAVLEKRAAKEKKIIMALFFAEQGAALAQVILDTALAISSIQAAWAAVPAKSIPLTALAVAGGIAATAAIGAARPKFHVGGVQARATPMLAPDEVNAIVKPEEVVLSSAAVSSLGGPRMADQLNRTSSDAQRGSPIVLLQQYGHRIFDEIVYHDYRRPYSNLKKAVTGKTRSGHASR